MFRFALLVLIMLTLVLSAPVQSQTFPASDAVEQTANGTINWTTGEVYAKGIGAPPAQTANAAQARAMAERAAFVVALRNLLETVKGVRVDSQTVVENFMVKSDIIRTRVDGIVKGAQVVKKQYFSDGSVEVLVGMNMKGAFLNAVMPDRFAKTSPQTGPPVIPRKPSDIRQGQPSPPAPSSLPEKKAEPVKPAPTKPEPIAPIPPAVSVPEKKQEPVQPSRQTPPQEKKAEPVKPDTPVPSVPETKPEPVKPVPPSVPQRKAEPDKPATVPDGTVLFKGGVATGLVIDARNLGLRPALLPRIVDQEGQEVYVGQVVTRTNAVEQGVAGYAKDVNAASNNFRVTDNPAVIKALSAAGTARTDIVIGQADASSLRRLSSQGDFLQYCRVIIVY